VQKKPGNQSEKPFGENVEGLLAEKSRGDKTAIELFITIVRGWEVGVRLRLDVETYSGH
jgi:hypothetical protein